ncbi:unnamed protein product [Musa acuminata subsp. burmannicoides]
MLTEKEDLALSLSLSSSTNHFDHSSPSRPLPSSCVQKPRWSHLLFAPSEDRPTLDVWRGAGEAQPVLRMIDVNWASSAAAAAGRDSEEEADASSPDSATSSVGGKRAERDKKHEAERPCSRGAASDEEDGDLVSRKKLRLSKDQSAILEESFKENSTLNPKQKLALAKQLNLRPRQVEVWFQNRRARTKLKQTEVDCGFLKRCCENLTEENRRLQKEVQELRALKLSPHFYTQMTPPTTLIMCPSCERTSKSSTATSSTNAPLPEHHQFLPHHRQVSAPWAPISLRPSFLDAPPQRS